MHEFFYDKFAAYEYHEFCFREIKADIETIFNIRGYEYDYWKKILTPLLVVIFLLIQQKSEIIRNEMTR